MSNVLGVGITLEDLLIGGNLFLRKHSDERKGDSKSTPAQFIVIEDGEKKTVVAENVVGWFEFLKRDGCRGLMIQPRTKETDTWDETNAYGMARKKNAFFGLNGPYIAAVHEDHAEYWILDGENVRHDPLPDTQVEFSGEEQEDVVWSIKKREQLSAATISLEERKEPLRTAIRELADVAKKMHSGNFSTNFFEPALQCLNGEMVLPSSAALLDPAIDHLVDRGILSREARQMMAAIAIAEGAYGGMGSWNDTHAEGEDQEKKRIADEKFMVLSEAAYADALNSAKWDA